MIRENVKEFAILLVLIMGVYAIGFLCGMAVQSRYQNSITVQV